ncbi:MAG: NADP(H)-dependent aldo-keto reductase [Nitrospirota bacterium]|nr:NADP(H)-dependent aldo-keto reductase [Nitrospirota bacterium]
MQFRPLGKSGLDVSVICLGTMTWGEQNTEAEAHAQLDRALDAGVNFIDAAEIYPVPTSAETYGATERIIGTWLAARHGRERVILATKAASRADWLPWIREGHPRLDRKNLEPALDASLQRLQTDYVDLYQMHWPDRTTNYFGELGYAHQADDAPIPVEETLAVLGDFVKAGKVRHVGLSNETPWGIMAFLRAAERHNLPAVVSVQNPYSLLNRTFEVGNAEVAIREQVGLLAYSPLAFGALSGKYLGVPPKGARLTLDRFSKFTRYTGPTGRTATAEYVNLARQHGLDPARMALAWVHSRPFTTSTIIGATTLEQLDANIASVDLTLPPEVVQGIEAIHARLPNPCP